MTSRCKAFCRCSFLSVALDHPHAPLCARPPDLVKLRSSTFFFTSASNRTARIDPIPESKPSYMFLLFFSGLRPSTRTTVRWSTKFGSQSLFVFRSLSRSLSFCILHDCAQLVTPGKPSFVSCFFLQRLMTVYAHRCPLVHQIQVTIAISYLSLCPYPT